MKPRILLYSLISSLVVGILLWIYFTTQSVRTDMVFDAAVNRDCAPWDGMAYTITIPDQTGSVIVVSIWKSPDFHVPVTYSFPDSSGRVGTSIHQSAFSSFQQVSGKITIEPFDIGSPLQGRFNFTLENGEQFIGNFKAEWGNQNALCG